MTGDEGADGVHGSLVDAAERARDLLLERPLEALRKVINPSALAEGATLSRSALYKLFQRPIEGELTPAQRANWQGYAEFQDGTAPAADAAIVAAAGLATDLVWADTADATAQVAMAWMGGTTPRDRLTSGLAANIRHQFRSKAVPVGWIIQAMAITASKAWQGPRSPDPDDAALAEALLEARRRQYAVLSSELLPFLGLAIEELRLRPEDGVEREQILTLMHCLMDGAVLRMMIDPDALSVELTAEAMVRLGEAFARQGSATDARRPQHDPDDRYGRLVAAAEQAWAGDGEPDLADLAATAGLAVDEVTDVFPTVAAAGDSLLWNLVGDSTSLHLDPDGRSVPGEVIFLAAAVSRLVDVATSHPAVTRLVFEADIERGFAYELKLGIANAVRRHSGGLPAEAIADQLIAAARTGDAGRPTLLALARAFELDLPELTTRPR